MAWTRGIRRVHSTLFKLNNPFVPGQRCIKTNPLTMSGDKGGLSLKTIVEELNGFANPKMAESWDNVGLLVEPATPTLVKHILLTNDLTEVVMEEALNLKTNLIISYHPPIFSGLKRITSSHWKERIIAKCLENRIAVYSPHTAWDAVHGGVADWLAESFEGYYELSSKNPLASPAITFETDCQHFGMGRIFNTNDLTLDLCLQLIKRHTGLPHIRIALATGKSLNSSVSTVALVPGSGGSLLKGVKADLFVTGEMFHHDILEANHSGTSVILTNHSDSERGFLKVFHEKVHSLFKDSVKFSISSKDRDPITTV